MKMPELKFKVPDTSRLRSFIWRKLIEILFFSPVGVCLALLFGMRAFEVGIVKIKGSTVKVSGICQVDGKDRIPAFNEDQVTITKNSDGVLTGVVRKTREAISCNVDSVAIDSLPLLKDFNNNPQPVPELTIPVQKEEESPVLSLTNKTLKISGICTNLKTNTSETFIDQIMLTSSGKKLDGSNEYVILGVIKDKQIPVQCALGSFNWEYAKVEEKDSRGNSINKEEDITGKVFLVTSTCFPDDRLPKTKNSDQLYYELFNSKIQITGYRYVNGKIAWISGAFLKKKTMIVCDETKFPIHMELFDPSIMKLDNLDDESKSK